MKITRTELREVIKGTMTEQKRSESHLINEGILSFLGDLFMGMANLALRPFGLHLGRTVEVSKEEAIALWEKQQAAGRTPPDVESVEELQPQSNDSHKEWIVTAVSGVWTQLSDESSVELDKAMTVKSWTPENETEEAQKAWEAENGDSAEGLWTAIGKLSGLGKYLFDQGLDIPEPSKDGQDVVKTGNPASAINFSIKMLDNYISWWNGEGSVSPRAGDVVKALEGVKAKFTELAKAVTADAKEEQAEQKNESRRRRVKTTRRKLRKVIREALMTESASEQALALLKSEYTVSSEKNVPGIRRDVNRETTYVRNDGQPVPPEDLKLLQDRDAEVRKKGGGMARLMGVYTSSMSPDGNSLIVKYHRTTAG